MTKLFTPIGHPTMRKKDIAPIKNPAFSKNLYQWMVKNGHEYTEGGVAQTVYRVKPGSKLAKAYGEGTLFIGCLYNQYEGDQDFSGSVLMAVLCNGAQQEKVCYPFSANAVEKIEGFWDQYLQVGRCAIDTQHEQYFINNKRYTRKGNIRTCLWCGAKHTLVKTPRVIMETIIEESWVLA